MKSSDDAIFPLHGRDMAIRYSAWPSKKDAKVKYKNSKPVACVLGIVALAVLVAAVDPAAQEIRLRKGDRLELSIPQRQELGRILTVGERGEVTIPIVGSVRLEGLTIKEAQYFLLGKLQDIYPSVDVVSLKLTEEESRRSFYVHGQVAAPGKYDLDGEPNVWEALREAGGSTANAALEVVRLIRGEGEGSRTIIVNLRQAIDSGDFSPLPTLKAGDTVVVPERSAGFTGSGAVNVIGAVVNPAAYMLSENRRLVDAIVAAGGPLENANLKKVTIVRRLAEGGMMTMQVDFKRYLDEGDTVHNPMVLPNDTVNISRESNSLRAMFTDPRLIVGLLTAAATVTAIALTR